ncbi:hypothetical protein niasHS_012228 [Heterodera schachtii]|uniref:Uncharacterized protein n=1 Tax=Heterodera schachtii TaxID=97005 RepID=A0ABD2IHQ4_HETSC
MKFARTSFSALIISSELFLSFLRHLFLPMSQQPNLPNTVPIEGNDLSAVDELGQNTSAGADLENEDDNKASTTPGRSTSAGADLENEDDNKASTTPGRSTSAGADLENEDDNKASTTPGRSTSAGGDLENEDDNKASTTPGRSTSAGGDLENEGDNKTSTTPGRNTSAGADLEDEDSTTPGRGLQQDLEPNDQQQMILVEPELLAVIHNALVQAIRRNPWASLGITWLVTGFARKVPDVIWNLFGVSRQRFLGRMNAFIYSAFLEAVSEEM